MIFFLEQGTVRNLRVSEETTNSFRVSWISAPGSVIRYRLTYVPLSGGGESLQAQTNGPETAIVLQELFPITTYRVSVAAEYANRVGDEMQVDGTTKEGESDKLLDFQIICFQHVKLVSDPFLFPLSPRLSSWPPCFQWDHIYNEGGLAGCSRKCPTVPHRL